MSLGRRGELGSRWVNVRVRRFRRLEDRRTFGLLGGRWPVRPNVEVLRVALASPTPDVSPAAGSAGRRAGGSDGSQRGSGVRQGRAMTAGAGGSVRSGWLSRRARHFPALHPWPRLGVTRAHPTCCVAPATDRCRPRPGRPRPVLRSARAGSATTRGP